MNFYSNCVRPLLFRLEAERAHNLAIDASAICNDLSFVQDALSVYSSVHDDRLVSEVSGIRFENSIGLAAGYDKSGRAVDTLAALGFGHIDVGSVSVDPSDGNPAPRLFRLPADRAVIVHYGLQNDGAHIIQKRLSQRKTTVPVSVNIVKTNRGINAPPEATDDIIDEYIRAVKTVKVSADFLTLNLSCPNTEDGRDFFSDPDHTRLLLSELSKLELDLPMFLKVSPLGGDAEIDALLDAVDPFAFVSGFIFNLAPGVHDNLTTPKAYWESLPGALAGEPVREQMNQKIRSLYQKSDTKRFRLIGAGGVTTAEDAYQKMRLGASLVQLLTALVYEGPGVVKRINKGLCKLMDRDGVKHISEVVGQG